MSLDKLTHKAASFFKTLPKGKKRISISFIIDGIRNVDGLGKILLSSYSYQDFDKKGKSSVLLESLIKESYYQALKLDHPYVGTEHVLLALLKLTESSLLSKINSDLIKYNVFSPNLKNLDSSKNTPIINQFGGNLTIKTFKNLSQPYVERPIYKDLVSALLLKESCGVLLIGEAGVGRTSLIELLSRKTSSFDVPIPLVGTKIIELDILSFMTSNISKGGFDLGITSLIEELKLLDKCILVLKNFDNLFVQTSGGISISMAYSVFKSALESADIKMIAEMNDSLYDRIIAENDTLLNGFTVVEVIEPNEKETLDILKYASKRLGAYHNVSIDSKLLEYIYKKTKNELTDIAFPKKGIVVLDVACTELVNKKHLIPVEYKDMVTKSFDIMANVDKLIDDGHFDEAVSRKNKLDKLDKRLENLEDKIFFDNKTYKLSEQDIDVALEKLAIKNIPVTESNLSKLSSLKTLVSKSIIGQDDAISKVVKALIRARLGLRIKKRPLGNFLFLGPTGVGKTELAKVLAATFYGSSNLIRLDMSDFGEKHNVSRLVGSPPGYVGYGEGGELTSKISTNPNSVVLFDEIEKAHLDVLNILLQILDEGELKDAKGQTFDFSHSVIILTSNAGTDILHKESLGLIDDPLPQSKTEALLKNNLKKILKPELLNRFDEIIIFKQLSKEEQYLILELLLKDVKEALTKQNITLNVSNQVKKYLIDRGYSKEYGARALRRSVEGDLLDKIADHLLEFNERPLKIVPRIVDNTLVI